MLQFSFMFSLIDKASISECFFFIFDNIFFVCLLVNLPSNRIRSSSLYPFLLAKGIWLLKENFLNSQHCIVGKKKKTEILNPKLNYLQANRAADFRFFVDCWKIPAERQNVWSLFTLQDTIIKDLMLFDLLQEKGKILFSWSALGALVKKKEKLQFFLN